MAAVSGTFTGTGQSVKHPTFGKTSILIDGGSGDVSIERSTDDGATWYIISKDSSGNPATYATGTLGFNGFIDEPEYSVHYRVNCSAFTSGTITYRIGNPNNA